GRGAVVIRALDRTLELSTVSNVAGQRDFLDKHCLTLHVAPLEVGSGSLPDPNQVQVESAGRGGHGWRGPRGGQLGTDSVADERDVIRLGRPHRPRDVHYLFVYIGQAVSAEAFF